MAPHRIGHHEDRSVRALASWTATLVGSRRDGARTSPASMAASLTVSWFASSSAVMSLPK